jgi:hypothetical protein
MADETLRIDFRGVDKEIRSSGRAAHIPEGDYLFKVVDSEIRTSDRSNSKYISWKMSCVSPKYKGKTIYFITSLKPNALWNLRNLIHACIGKNVAGSVANFKPKTLHGKVFAGTTEDDSYMRNAGGDDEREVIRSVLADVRPRDELVPSEEDEDEEDEEEYEEEEEDEDEEDEEEEEEEPPARARRRTKPATAKARAKPKRRAQDEEEDDLENVDVDEI